MRVAAAVLCTVLAGTTARSAAASASDGGFELDLLLHTAMTAHAVPELDEPTELGSLAYTSSAADIGLRRSLRISETIVGRASPGDGGKVHFYRQLPPVVKLDHVTAWLSDDVEGGSKRGKLSLRRDDSAVLWTVEGKRGSTAKVNITITYTINDAVTNIKRNPFIGLKIQRVEWPVEMLLATSKADPEKLVRVEVTPDDLVVGLGINARNKKHAAGDRFGVDGKTKAVDQERFALCGNRGAAMYSRSGTDISKRTACKACDASKKNCATLEQVNLAKEAVTPSLLGSEEIVRIPAGFDFKGTDTVVFRYTFGTVLPDVGMVSDDKTAFCKQMLYSEDVGLATSIFVDALFPLKVLFLFVPLGLILLILGANLSYYIGRPAMILVATGAIVTDLMFFAGSAIFPLCSVVTTGRGFGIDGAVGLVVYYVGFFFAFKYVDKILEQQCPMPPQIKAMNLPGVLRSIQMMLPPWLQVIPACIVVYVWAMLYLVTGLIAKELAVPFICLAANGVVAGAALPLLKASIAESRKAGKSTGFVKACFLLQLLEPVVALVMFLTVGLEVGVQVCGVATLLGAAYGYKKTASLRAAQAQMANVPFKPAPLQRMKGLRPKQRALLEAQLAAKEARKAKSDASLTPSV